MTSINLSRTTPAGLVRHFHSARLDPDRDPDTLLLIACALLYSSCRHDPPLAGPVMLGFEYHGGPVAAAIRIAYFTTEDGQCLTDERVRVLLACRYGQFTLTEMLNCGACDHLDHHYSYWRQENGTRGMLAFAIHENTEGRLSVEARGRANLTSTPGPADASLTGDTSAAFEPESLTRPLVAALSANELARRYDALPNNELEEPASFLTVAAALLLKAALEIVPGRECASITFEFEGDSEATRVEIIGIDDAQGHVVEEANFLVSWKPCGVRTTGSYLADAVSRYLDRVVPEWRQAPGSEGYVNLSVGWREQGELQAVATGRARIWTRTDRLLTAN